MASGTTRQPGLNDWMEQELLRDYRRDPGSVDPAWRKSFDAEPNGKPGGPVAAATPPPVDPGGELVALRGAAARIVENMTASLAIPMAASQRVVPVRRMEKNRELINRHRTARGESKLSYTHIAGWAIIRSVVAHPGLNCSFTQNTAGEPFRVVKPEINFGLAVDVAGKNGARSLMVPNIRNAGAMDFVQYLQAFDDIVARARNAKLTPGDFQGTTISLTNPGTVGTTASNPRLMPGQGAIVATGAIDYPAEYRDLAPESISALGIGKVMTVTCAYDHRIIQGAESGMFLNTLATSLEGRDDFYAEIFKALQIMDQPAANTVIVPSVSSIPSRATSTPAVGADAEATAAVIQLIHAYRVRGHLSAELDPLGTIKALHPDLDPINYGLTAADLDRNFWIGNLRHAFGGNATAPLGKIVDLLRATYCRTIGCEYMYIQRIDEKLWLQSRMEPEANSWALPAATRLRVLESILTAEEFEHFLQRRFIGQKRFSLEGAETAIAILKELANLAADADVEEIVIGMAHRGRLNVLANVIGKPTGQIFSEFEGNIDPDSTQGSGDVKYHLGAIGVHKAPSSRSVKVSLVANPSHLEAVNPVVEGIARARQDKLTGNVGNRILPLLVHGDAAFIGQGVVAETLNLSQLDGYSTGGTIHLVINNQIGFTTLPDDSRSTVYATDIARMVQAPIFHVNGDDPDACVRVVQMAWGYRQQFGRDVVIDMICYRRHGHNETDDPAYTQPVMYRRIEKLASVANRYGGKIVADGLLPEPGLTTLRSKIAGGLNAAFDANKSKGKWVLQPAPRNSRTQAPGNISRKTLERIVEGILRVPASFHVHPKLDSSFLKKRRTALVENGTIDWAYAEALAFGSLVLAGTPVRLSGQDSGRGTFSQRHLALHDYETGERYVPLQHMSEDQARFDLVDSSLSEFAVLGFEYGYSVAALPTLTLWEGQFGDFANGAQVIIDQFITTGEQKWGQQSGLVMLLPHGYEGQGPEHSSARMERFLVLCAEENIRIVNCTTPAQYFHVLRRQAMQTPKPMVIFTPKSLLRSPLAVSKFSDITQGAFQPVIGDDLEPAGVRKIVFCCGKVYYDLLTTREAKKIKDVALVRVEDLYPFPHEHVAELLARYKKKVELIWAQEEPRNMGAWRFIIGRFDELDRKISYAGRKYSASPAAGSAKRHAQEQKQLVEDALK